MLEIEENTCAISLNYIFFRLASCSLFGFAETLSLYYFTSDKPGINFLEDHLSHP